jgi:hypothetical protein
MQHPHRCKVLTMDASGFNRFTRDFSTFHSRRRFLLALALGALGVPLEPESSAAGPGCNNVGETCENAAECCSNICTKKQKKGKKKCRPHGATSCKAGQHEPVCISGGKIVKCKTTSGAKGICNTTTGKA